LLILFANICRPNNESRSEKIRQEFINNCQDYSIHSKTNINVELIDKGVRCMKTGKAAGSDCIETKHLLNAHSIIG